MIVLAFLAVLLWPKYFRAQSYDLVIEDGLIFDGSTKEPFRGSIGIHGRKISEIWNGYRPLTDRTPRIAADGLAVAPGFIDTHSHADLQIDDKASSPIDAWNYVAQGVTTIITGNCGRSKTSIRGLANTIEGRGINVNVASFIGHNSIKREVMPGDKGNPNDLQKAEMESLARRAMANGALGVSTGFAYLPGRFSKREEVVPLLGIAQEGGGLHATHLRDEAVDGYEALKEAIELSQEANNIPLIVSHFKIAAPTSCGDLDRRLALIRYARLHGLPVSMDFYPYEASSSSLELLLPDWFAELNNAQRRQALNNRNQLADLTHDIRQELRREGFSSLSFARVAYFTKEPAWRGKTLSEIVTLKGWQSSLENEVKVLKELLLAGGAQMIYHNLCPGVMEEMAIMSRDERQRSVYAEPEPYDELDYGVMVGTDSAIRPDPDSGYAAHPRGCGAFPRFLRTFAEKWRHSRGLGRYLEGILSPPFSSSNRGPKSEAKLSWQEAIHQITALPARVFRLPKRGRIVSGFYADLVVFDPSRLRDEATFEEPYNRPSGITHVLVNGQSVIDQGRAVSQGSGQKIGDFLRLGKKPAVAFAPRPTDLKIQLAVGSVLALLALGFLWSLILYFDFEGGVYRLFRRGEAIFAEARNGLIDPRTLSWKSALNAYDQLVELYPKNGDLRIRQVYSQARVLQASGKLDEARRQVERILKAQPYWPLANALMRELETPAVAKQVDAAEALRKAQARAQKDHVRTFVDFWLTEAKLEYQQGHFSNALDYLFQVLCFENDPKQWDQVRAFEQKVRQEIGLRDSSRP